MPSMFPNAVHRWSRHESWWARHSLSIVLLVILVAQTIAFHFTELPDWTSDQATHGEPTALWPAYWLHFSAEWFVSVLADTYGALLLVVLTKWFYEQGSAETEGQGNGSPDQG